jgi:hypothetical protein
MAHWQSNRSDPTVRSRYAWRWLRKGNNGKQARKSIKFSNKLPLQGFGVAIYWIKKNSDLQNPPSGPPIFSI